jgi:hypothetical protein
MTTFENLTNQSDINKISIPPDDRRDVTIGRIDLLAILVSFLTIFLLAMATLVLAIIEFVKIVSWLCSDPLGCGVIIILGLAIAWVVTRGK